MAERTAGPWKLTDHSSFVVFGSDGAPVADTFTMQRHASECEANARFIIVGPDLLEAGGGLLDALLAIAPSTMYARIIQDAITEWLNAVDRAEGREPPRGTPSAP